METRGVYQALIEQKLQMFERLQPEFERCFRFVQEVHGQRRFLAFPISEIVHYLHALWVCECKDRLLSVYKNIMRYEGQTCLFLLRRWQTDEQAEVVAFLQRKLDGLPFADLTRQIQEAHVASQGEKEQGVLRRLVHGRQVLLNRGINLMLALDAVFALPEEERLTEVQAVCRSFGHTPEHIEQQLAELEDSRYAYAPHPCLAQRNMLVMNALGRAVMTLPTDQPGDRSWKVLTPGERPCPWAEHQVSSYLELLSPWYNNLKRHRFSDPPEWYQGMVL